MDYRIKAPAAAVDCLVQLPPSKSIAIRALLLDALCDGECREECCHGCDAAADIKVMSSALASNDDRIDVGGTGAAMRMLTAYFATRLGRTVVLDGDHRMRERPLGELVRVLRLMGASIDYLGGEGFPPLRITGRQLVGGAQCIDGSVSSQYISALLMIAPLAGGIKLTIEGKIVSRPYIDMTMAMMQRRGIDAHWQHDSIVVVPAGNYKAQPLAVEPDWSAASYWLAMQALVPGSTIRFEGLPRDSIQGDRAIVEMMAPLGVGAAWNDEGLCLTSTGCELPRFYGRDMSANPDLVPTLAVTLSLLNVPFRLTGVANLAIKESDRLQVLQEQLQRLGHVIDCDGTTLAYNGERIDVPKNISLDAHGDHRMAMALSLAATRHPGITIVGGEVVAKSYPQWWNALQECAGWRVESF